MPSREQQAILTAAVRTGLPHYLQAVAGELDGSPADRHWFAFRRTLARAFVLAGLAGVGRVTGTARVRGADIDLSQEPVRPQHFARAPRVSLGEDDDTFIAGPFLEAVQAFDSRVPHLRETVDMLARRAKELSAAITAAERAEVVEQLRRRSVALREAIARSFWVSDVGPREVVSLKNLVANILRGEEPDITLPGFIQRAHLLGARNLTAARLEVVYRNNLNSAYNEGQAAALRGTEVRRVIPIVMIDEINDRRTRGNPSGLYPDRGFHWQIDGYINTIDEIERQGLRPPNGHQCRATLRPISVGEARRMGLVNEDGSPNAEAIRRHNGERQAIIDRGDYPDRGFKVAA